LNEDDFFEVGTLIARAVFNQDNEAELEKVGSGVAAIVDKYPLYPEYQH